MQPLYLGLNSIVSAGQSGPVFGVGDIVYITLFDTWCFKVMPVIAPGQGGISWFITLADGEFLPEDMNSEKSVVFRRGESTNRKMKIVKPFGKLATVDLLRPAPAPVCDYLERMEGGDPLHEHADGTWWFYEQNFQMENGPYESWEEAHACLVTYCELLQEYLSQKSVENPGLTNLVDKVENNEVADVEKLDSDLGGSGN